MTAKQRRNKATHLSKQPTVTPEKIARNPPEGLKSLHHQARVSTNAHGLNPEIYLLRLNLDSLKQTKNLLGSSSLDLRPEITLWENVTGSLRHCRSRRTLLIPIHPLPNQRERDTSSARLGLETVPSCSFHKRTKRFFIACPWQWLWFLTFSKPRSPATKVCL